MNTAKKRPSPHSRWDRAIQIVLLSLIAAGIVAIIITSGAGSGAEGQGPKPAITSANDKASAVEVESVGRSTVQEFIKVNGDVVSGSSVDIYPDSAGKIVSVNVELGSTVQRGTVVAVVDPSLPGQVYSYSNVVSTVSGTVTELNFDTGDTVSKTSAVATIGNLDDLEIVTYVPERFTASLSKGLIAEVRFDSYPGELIQARVTQISPVLDMVSRSQKVTLSPIKNDTRIKVGMFASVSIVTKEARDVVTVPPLALGSYYNRDVVYVLNGDVAERREVTLGLKSTEAVQITDGLQAGETVIIRGLSGVSDGSVVRVVE